MSLLRLKSPFCCVLLLVTTGCATTGERVRRIELPAGSPQVGEILRDLETNDSRIENFRAAGTFTMESPDFDSTQRFRSGRVIFRRPADLYVQGNHRVTNIPMFKLTSVGKEFLLEVPTNYKQNYYKIEGEEFEDVPFSVSPSDIAREMFLPEQWDELGRTEARLVQYSPAQNVAVVEIGPRRAPRRRIEVTLINPEAPAWVIARNVRLGDDGRVLAVTELSEFRMQNAIRFPTKIQAEFPTEATYMSLELRNVRINTDVPEDVFDIEARARELNLSHVQPDSRTLPSPRAANLSNRRPRI